MINCEKFEADTLKQYDYLEDMVSDDYFRQKEKLLKRDPHFNYGEIFEKLMHERDYRSLYERHLKVGTKDPSR